MYHYKTVLPLQHFVFASLQKLIQIPANNGNLFKLFFGHPYYISIPFKKSKCKGKCKVDRHIGWGDMKNNSFPYISKIRFTALFSVKTSSHTLYICNTSKEYQYKFHCRSNVNHNDLLAFSAI